MRDTITPVTDGKLTVNISDYGNEIKSLDYQVYTLDGKKQLKEAVIKNPGESADLELGNTSSKKSDSENTDESELVTEEEEAKSAAAAAEAAKKAAGQMTETDDELMQELLSRAESDLEEE